MNESQCPALAVSTKGALAFVQKSNSVPPRQHRFLCCCRRFSRWFWAVASLFLAWASGLPAAVPSVVTAPQAQSAASGASVTLNVVGAGDAPLTYEWWGEFGPLVPTQTNASLVFSAVELSDAGLYRVVIRNAAGSVVSPTARLSVTPPTGAGAGGNLFWARTAGGAGADPGANLAVDGAGNSYLVGTYTGSATVGGTVLGGSGGSDLLVAKFNRAGSLLWVRKAGGSGNDAGAGVAVDDFGNVHVTGSFSGSADFSGVTLTSAGASDLFVACYDRSGRLLWARPAGGSGADRGLRLAVDAAGNSFVTGTFTGTATFGSVSLTSAGAEDIFLAKFSSSGLPLWAKRFGGNVADGGTSVAAGPLGTVFVAGRFRGPAGFGGVTLNDGGGTDLFLAKCDHAGNVLWARNVSGAESAGGAAVALGEDGSSYLSGTFSAPTTFGPVTITNREPGDHFIASYDSDGDVSWVARVGGLVGQGSTLGIESGDGGSVTPLATGNVDYSGGLGGDVDLVVGRYSGPNSLIWGQDGGTRFAPFSLGQLVDELGDPYLLGFFEEPEGGARLPGYSLALIKLARSSPQPIPLITLQPQTRAVNSGAAVSFSVTASADTPLSYQWFFNGMEIVGAQDATYTIPSAQSVHRGAYSVVVFDVDGSATSREAVLGVQAPSTPPNLFGPARGTYNGLFFETNAVRHDSSGFLTLSASERGTFTASLRTGGRVLAFNGRFTSEGRATNQLNRAGTNALQVVLELPLDGNEVLIGRISDGQWNAELAALKMTLHATTNRAPFAGRYTMQIPGEGDGSVRPGGDGFGTIVVGPGGAATLTATLADGTPNLSQRTPVSREGLWPFYVSLYNGKGSVLGWMRFADGPTNDVSGLLSWMKPSLLSTKFYPNGFTIRAFAVGALYDPTETQALGAPGFPGGGLELKGGNLGLPVRYALPTALSNRTIRTNGVTLKFTAATGLYSGSAIDPQTGRPVAFKGAVLQKLNAGCGWHLGTNRTGRVTLTL